MRLSWWCNPLLIGAAAALFGPACSVQQGDASRYTGIGATAAPGPDTQLEFEQASALSLGPGEVRELVVVSDPPAPYEISFALLGDTFDASLDQAKIVAGWDGVAVVKLKAPTVPTSFRVRASIEAGPVAEAKVSVSDTAVGAIHVVPAYAGGREVALWTTSVTPGSNCKSIAATSPNGEPEGAMKVSAAALDDLVIHNVPVGPSLAVVLRSGSAIWGCSDVPSVQADQIREVKVTVVDRPIDLLATDMDVTFSFLPSDPASYAELISVATTALAKSFLPASVDESAGALLEAMKGAAPAGSDAAFDQQRAALGWDALVVQRLESLPASLPEQAVAWAVASLIQQPLDPLDLAPTLQITGRLRSVAAAQGKALLSVQQIGAVAADAAGVPAMHLVTWTADSSDTVMLGGTIFWLPSRFVGAAASIGAQADPQGAASVPEALAKALGCDALAAEMGGFDACDVQCTAALCGAAIAARWEQGLDASAALGQVGQTSISASGPAKVDSAAAPASFNGKWLGVLSVGELEVPVEGTVDGVVPPAPPN